MVASFGAIRVEMKQVRAKKVRGRYGIEHGIGDFPFSMLAIGADKGEVSSADSHFKSLLAMTASDVKPV